jgi:chromosomal replication initiation ATPase DnaA
MRQGTLDLPVETGFGAADFLVSGCNREASEWIERWPAWPSPALALYGPSGCGKTHLAHLWCERTGGTLIQGSTVADAVSSAAAAVAVDDAEQAREEPLLHLYNSALERGANVLLTMPAAPASLLLALPDLASRLRALPVVGIAPPDDPLLGAVLVKHFNDRQIRVRPGVIAYLVAHIERSFAAAASVAARLDEAALAAARPITIKLVREVLENVGG